LADAISDAAQPVAYPDTPSGVVADLIIETGIGRIPIVDRITHCVVGILSRQDLLKARSANRLAETGRSRFVSRKSAANAMGPAAS
jgi:CBS-domain-containing membrane protein